MRYCVDTWFLLALFDKDQKAIGILENAKYGKDWILIPLVVFAETIKKLFQRGIPEQKITEFFEAAEASEKVQIMYPEKEIAKEAAKISLMYAVPMLDSFVAATAKISHCDILISGDSDYSLLAKKKVS